MYYEIVSSPDFETQNHMCWYLCVNIKEDSFVFLMMNSTYLTAVIKPGAIKVSIIRIYVTLKVDSC